MEYQMQRESCAVCETVFEGTKEQPIDLDFTLPDYCPDIERILKCRVTPSLTSRNLSADMLELDGSVLMSLYYLDAKKQAIRLCEHTMPFSCSFSWKTGAEEAAALVRLRTEYLNCRALSPRRVDIHGAVSAIVTVCARNEQEYFSHIEGEDIQQSRRSAAVSRLCGIGQQQFSLTEVLDIGAGKGHPESILRSDLSVRCDSVKAMSDKLMVGGEAVLRMLYVTDLETGAQDTMTFHIPFSQVLDVRGVSDSTTNEVLLEVMNYDTTLKSEFDENSTLVTLDARLCATVLASEETNVEWVEDAYSTEYELSLTKKPCRFIQSLTVLKEEFSAKSEVNTGENGITKIIDLWCDSVSSICVAENEQMTVRGKVNCCMLALDGEGVPYYLERPVDFSVAPEVLQSMTHPTVKAEVKAENLSFRITGDDRVEIKAELCLTGTAYMESSWKGITAAEGLDDRCRRKDKAAALTLYYADEGERLWDIACAYCTSVEAVKLENDLTEDVMTAAGMILIPM